jgi:hypothetical protein
LYKLCLTQLSRYEVSVLFGGAAVGGLLGVFIGGVVGSETVIEQRNARITPVAPRGSTAGFTDTF